MQPSNNTPETFDENLLDQIFTNPEEEIMFNYDEIDEDESEESYDQQINMNIDQNNNRKLNENDITNLEGNEINNTDIIAEEQNDNYNDTQTNTRTRQPKRKYQDFYQFIMKQETNKNMDMEIKEYNNEDAQIIATFLHHKLTGQNKHKYHNFHNIHGNRSRDGDNGNTLIFYNYYSAGN